MSNIGLSRHDYLLPDWAAPTRVKALVTTRRGGVSKAPYGAYGGVYDARRGSSVGEVGSVSDSLEYGSDAGGLNLGLHTGDDVEAVTANRARLQTLLGGRRIAWLDQCHGTDAVLASEAWDAAIPPRADAVVTADEGVACAIMVADCMPVLLCDRAGTAVGAAHAGWRGLCGGVLEHAAERVAALAADSTLMAYLGPAIGPSAFEVGAEVREAFLDAALPSERDATAAAFGLLPFAGPGAEVRLEARTEARANLAPGSDPRKYLGDLAALARLRLARMGIREISGGGLCTYSDPARFYSYRRDARTGRQAALVWLDGGE